ncbi:MAG TPA: hypothetical protein VFA95_11690 [Gammaproteobacteria bacterium]|nr:hypothetical protein [Gammaproteobacteria bacterium]
MARYPNMMPTTHQRLLGIRAALRHRFHDNGVRYWDGDQALHKLARAHVLGIPLNDLDARARDATNWSQFFGAIDALLSGEQD